MNGYIAAMKIGPSIQARFLGRCLQFSFLFLWCSCTPDPEFSAPLVQTGNVTEITSEGARFNGLVTFSGKGSSQVGFVWSLSPNPTVAASSKISFTSATKGPLSTTVTYDLKETETYFIRAFGQSGNEVVYGEEVKFQSLGSLAPVIESVDPVLVGVGSTISVVGRNFSQLASNVVARLGGIPLTVLTATSKLITVQIPKGFLFSGKLKLRIEISGVVVEYSDYLTVAGPIINAFQPARVVGGDTITLVGSGFSPTLSDNLVRFGSTPGTLLSATATELVVVVPFYILAADYYIDVYIQGIRCRPTDLMSLVSPWAEVSTSTNKPEPSQVAVQFTVGSTIYTGLDLSSSFWKYVPSTNTWTSLSAYPGNGKVNCFGFSLGTKGYVGLGNASGNAVGFQDVWEYNTLTNSWTALPNFPGQARLKTAQFVLNGKAYVGLGLSNGIGLKDFWEFNPSSGTWTQLSDFPGAGAGPHSSMSIKDKGYIIIGKAFWSYNPANDSWTQLGNTPQSGIQQTTASVDGRGFLFGGVLGGIRLNEVWEYSIQTDDWQRRPNTITPAIHLASAIGVDGKIQIIGGHTGTGYTDKIYVYTPKP